MRDVLEGPGEQLLAGVADDIAQPFVDAQEAAVGIAVRDTDSRVLKGAAESLLALAQCAPRLDSGRRSRAPALWDCASTVRPA